MYNIYIYTHTMCGYLRYLRTNDRSERQRLCCSLQIEVDLACTHLAQLELTRLTMLGHDHTYLGRWLIWSEDANAVSLYVMNCHDVSSFKRRLADHPPFRPAYSTKRNMPGLVWCLEAEHGFELPGWEWGDGMGAILTTLPSCMLEVTGSIFSGAQGPDRTHLHPLHANSASWSHKCHVAQVSEYDRQKVYAGWLRS
jgi:hypothetical protein